MSDQPADVPDALGKILVEGVEYQLIRIGAVPLWMERVGHMAPVDGVEQPTACSADCGGDTVYRLREPLGGAE